MNNYAADYPLANDCSWPLSPKASMTTTSPHSCNSKPNQVATVTRWTICDLDATASFLAVDGTHHWSLRGLFMHMAHPTNNTCAFFQAIDNYSVGQGMAFTMLPSTAAFGQNAVLGLLPFTWWLLEPVYGKWQSQDLDIAFHPSALQDIALAMWDPTNNCIQQKEGDLLSWALNDLDNYDLQSKLEATPLANVLVDTMGNSAPGETTWCYQPFSV